MRKPYAPCVKCGDEHAQITIDLPEGDTCATCVIEEVKRLRLDAVLAKKRWQNQRCGNCACWDSDPSSAPDVKIPAKTHARVCFALTIQDWYAGDFHSDGAVATKEEFYCSHFEKKGP